LLVQAVANTMQESTRPRRLLTMGSRFLHGESPSLPPPTLSIVARLPVLDSRAEDVTSTDLLDLVRRCRSGDPDAWRALLSPFQEVGRRTLRSFRLSAADLDDILADALAALYAGGLAQFKGTTVAELVGFLKAIVRNRAIDFVKDRRNGEAYPEASAEALVTSAVPYDISHGIADDECLEFLRQEVDKLKREDRELYLMKARGLKEREIAEQTGRPPGTVASQIARLLERLRSRLKDRGCV
jgi:RNA polymerase sigma factor (sigma-70 family)